MFFFELLLTQEPSQEEEEVTRDQSWIPPRALGLSVSFFGFLIARTSLTKGVDWS